MKSSPKKARGASKSARGHKKQDEGQICAFLESPNDPYYLPSDAEDAQASLLPTRKNQKSNCEPSIRPTLLSIHNLICRCIRLKG